MGRVGRGHQCITYASSGHNGRATNMIRRSATRLYERNYHPPAKKFQNMHQTQVEDLFFFFKFHSSALLLFNNFGLKELLCVLMPAEPRKRGIMLLKLKLKTLTEVYSRPRPSKLRSHRRRLHSFAIKITV